MLNVGGNGLTDLSPLADFLAYEESVRGGVQVAAADVDGDGFAEVFTAPWSGGAARIRGFAIGPDGPAAQGENR